MNREMILALLADDQHYREVVADAVAKWHTPAVGPAMDVVEYETRTTDAYRQAAQRWQERCEKAEAERDALAADHAALFGSYQRVLALSYANDDGAEYEHNGHAPNEGESECPGCWAAAIRRALDGGES